MVYLSSEQTPESGHTIILDFSINMYAISGLRVDSLKIFNEGYKPYKVCYIKFNFLIMNEIINLIYKFKGCTKFNQSWKVSNSYMIRTFN